MATRVTTEVGHDEVMIVTMHNPPVNALAPAGVCCSDSRIILS